MESEAEGAHDFVSSLARAQVGGVSPRPPDRGRSCTLLGREPLLEAIAFGLTRRWFAGDPAVSARRALPPRPPTPTLRCHPGPPPQNALPPSYPPTSPP